MKSLSTPMTKRDQVIISLFVISYFFVIGISLIANCPLRKFVHPITRNAELFFGIDQSWRMFCPNPRDFNFHPYAVITFQDGGTAYYEFPRGDKMTQLNAFFRERMRKHFYDIMPWDDFSVFRPTIARYIARCFANPYNQPSQVSLCYNGDPISLMATKMIHRNQLPVGTNRKTYFVYQVSPEDFK